MRKRQKEVSTARSRKTRKKSDAEKIFTEPTRWAPRVGRFGDSAFATQCASESRSGAVGRGGRASNPGPGTARERPCRLGGVSGDAPPRGRAPRGLERAALRGYRRASNAKPFLIAPAEEHETPTRWHLRKTENEQTFANAARKHRRPSATRSARRRADERGFVRGTAWTPSRKGSLDVLPRNRVEIRDAPARHRVLRRTTDTGFPRCRARRSW